MQIVYLYPTTENDFDDYYMVRSDPDDIYWNGYTNPPEKEGFKKGFLKRTASARFEQPEDRRNYLIKETVSDLTVGFVQFIRKEDCVEIGYSVSNPFQKRGYATQALAQGIKLAEEFGLPLIVRIREDNIPSQKVALKNGFVKTDELTEKTVGVGTIVLRTYALKR